MFLFLIPVDVFQSLYLYYYYLFIIYCLNYVDCIHPVSYTHLDVYKRQLLHIGTVSDHLFRLAKRSVSGFSIFYQEDFLPSHFTSPFTTSIKIFKKLFSLQICLTQTVNAVHLHIIDIPTSSLGMNNNNNNFYDVHYIYCYSHPKLHEEFYLTEKQNDYSDVKRVDRTCLLYTSRCV